MLQRWQHVGKPRELKRGQQGLGHPLVGGDRPAQITGQLLADDLRAAAAQLQQSGLIAALVEVGAVVGDLRRYGPLGRGLADLEPKPGQLLAQTRGRRL